MTPLVCAFWEFPRGPCDWKKAIPIDRMKFPIHTLESFNLGLKISIRDWKFQSRLKISIPTLIIPHNRSLIFNPAWKFQSRLKFSIWDWSLESFNPGAKSWIFSIFGPSGLCKFMSVPQICTGALPKGMCSDDVILFYGGTIKFVHDIWEDRTSV